MFTVPLRDKDDAVTVVVKGVVDVLAVVVVVVGCGVEVVEVACVVVV